MSTQGKLFAPGSSGLSSCDHIRSCDRRHSHSLSCHIPRKCNICLKSNVCWLGYAAGLIVFNLSF